MEEFDYEEYLDEYFDPMELTEEEKEERKDIAKEIREAVLFWFWLLMLAFQYAVVDLDNLKMSLRSRLAQVVYNHSTPDAYTVQYLDILTNSIFDTTMKDVERQRQEESVEQELEQTYAFSDERATFIGANEANTVCNRETYLEAIEAGYTHKTWKTFEDDFVRKDHRPKNGIRMPIKQYFHFPDCKGLFPHDETHLSAKQVINCRCLCDWDKGNSSISPDRVASYNNYSKSWESESLEEAIDRFAPNAIEVYNSAKTKLLYEGKDHIVVADAEYPYFRIEDKNSTSKRRKYVTMDGTNPTNEKVNGTWRGTSKARYNQLTHFMSKDVL